jgi:DNA-binding transcriptional ArsR family regulator
MAKLKEVGLVDSEKRGIWVYYSLGANLAPATRKLLANLLD